MLTLLFFATVAAASPHDGRLAQTAHAIRAGRIEQARTMLAGAIAAGARGEDVEILLADLAYASGRTSEALARYEALLARRPDDRRSQERALIAALKIGNLAKAAILAPKATSSARASWRAWNARGVTADLHGDWPEADAAYVRALELSPQRAEIHNNQGWSRLLRGDWEGAITSLEQAQLLNSALPRLGNNLDFARAALSTDLPARRAGESEEQWASRLNDAGIAAQSRGETARAIAAFSRAIETRRTWYKRAANNLRIAQAAQ